MVSFLVGDPVALVIISVLTSVSTLERLLFHVNVHLVIQERLSEGEFLSTVAAMELLVLLSCVHCPHVKLDFPEHSPTDVAC